ncbi:translation elongation factor Ts [Candidatus Peregrinibacteria bacterium]|nr:translation elongation factor Ts [Candidatus Peregrinibacteria bacterium]
MTTISAAAVQSLRARTGVSILAVKQALEEAGGNEEKAIEILRKRGIAQAVKKADRDQSEGAIFIESSGSKAGIVLLKCETDFVARDAGFRAVGQAIAKELLGKGADAAKKLAEAKIPEAVNKLGENITVSESILVEAPVIGTYVHSNSKIGVVIGLDPSSAAANSGQAELVAKARDVAMHAAAMNPLYTTPEEVPGSAVEKEKEIWKEQLAKEGKPQQILEKIMLGKEKKFREENALVKQPFVKDNSKTVEQYLGGSKVTAYMRVAIG